MLEQLFCFNIPIWFGAKFKLCIHFFQGYFWTKFNFFSWRMYQSSYVNFSFFLLLLLYHHGSHKIYLQSLVFRLIIFYTLLCWYGLWNEKLIELSFLSQVWKALFDCTQGNSLDMILSSGHILYFWWQNDIAVLISMKEKDYGQTSRQYKITKGLPQWKCLSGQTKLRFEAIIDLLHVFVCLFVFVDVFFHRKLGIPDEI